jgi:hypothetical protein
MRLLNCIETNDFLIFKACGLRLRTSNSKTNLENNLCMNSVKKKFYLANFNLFKVACLWGEVVGCIDVI